MLLNLALSLLTLVCCVGGVILLAGVLTWQERAPTPTLRQRLLLYLVLPATVGVVATILGALALLFYYWTPIIG